MVTKKITRSIVNEDVNIKGWMVSVLQFIQENFCCSKTYKETKIYILSGVANSY